MIVPFVLFAISSIFSPGPANIVASAFGQEVGYSGTLRFLLGMALCFTLGMAAAGLMAGALRVIFPIVATYLRWAGALYMAWLAASLFLHQRGGGPSQPRKPGFVDGLLIIITNPKLYFFAAALFASFGAQLARTVPAILLLSLVLGLLQFIAASTWVMVGYGLSLAFRGRTFSIVFRVVMALLLVVSAVLTIVH